MTHELALLAATPAGIGFLHALLGPDHYLPFVLMGRAGRWSRAKTLTITFFCGVGHVGSSLLLAAGGVALGVAVGRLQVLEGLPGRWRCGRSSRLGCCISSGACGGRRDTGRTPIPTCPATAPWTPTSTRTKASTCTCTSRANASRG